ncbi:hypothetical protein [Neolewinella antarctica]|uniref:Uncharacterized protein n=1 Tax=Neolewinella antarctica TaxID=442734 RepID=A0ABX0XAP1_9BACT|nr:hypothetical protein [Neolewinella antarctica]NJC26349.1 hypothetical protein [Neolewinella antarctica]
MQQSSTHLDLVTYLYGESTTAQAQATEKSLAGDPVLRHEFTDLVQAQASLPKVRFSARKRLLQVIRKYAAGPDLQLSV